MSTATPAGQPAIAVIGLGVMGLPMAQNLVTAGYPVTGFNRSSGRLDELAASGGARGGSIADAVGSADVIITMLPDAPDVTAVLQGSDGVFSHARGGAAVIEMSTIAPRVARELAAAATDSGMAFLDAPVSGGESGAIEGTLSIMVGGPAHTLAGVRPVLDVLGATIAHVGPAGAGQTVKAANQLIVAGTIQVVAEALTFLDAHEIDLETACSVLAGGLAGNRILDRKAGAMIAHDFRPGFRAELHHKDLGILTAAAREAGVVIPVGALTAELMASLCAQGRGELDHSALLLAVEQLSGRSERPRRSTSV